ncbi:MAG: SAM-dependent methyltransferase [Myxococcota bacterium]|jgi:SAM-dependent methyltransferase
MWTHEQSYQGLSLRAQVHRSRLKMIEQLFEQMSPPQSGKMADFGCSDAYILSILQEQVFQGKDWDFCGFDHAESSLTAGRKRGLARTELNAVDITKRLTEYDQKFDITMCLETLEHTSNAHEGLLTLHQVTRPGGTIFVSIPNETGIQGLVKLLARPLYGRNPHGDFFEGQSRRRYVWHLLTGRRIDVFRGERPDGWGPHLGFDHRVFEKFMQEQLIDTGLCRLKLKTTSFFDFNLFYLLERI